MYTGRPPPSCDRLDGIGAGLSAGSITVEGDAGGSLGRGMRGGKLNDGNFGSRMHGDGIFAAQIHKMFEVACRKTGLDKGRIELSTAAFREPSGTQLSLFGENG
jgi:hypothetical protein